MMRPTAWRVQGFGIGQRLIDSILPGATINDNDHKWKRRAMRWTLRSCAPL